MNWFDTESGNWNLAPRELTIFKGIWSYVNQHDSLRSETSVPLRSAHFEPRQGSPDQARDYCRKLETRIGGPMGVWNLGKISRQTIRS